MMETYAEFVQRCQRRGQQANFSDPTLGDYYVLSEDEARVTVAFGVTEAEYLARYPGGRKGYVRDTSKKLAAREEEGGIAT